jgi:K+-sensing histidine kinase KdpD
MIEPTDFTFLSLHTLNQIYRNINNNLYILRNKSIISEERDAFIHKIEFNNNRIKRYITQLEVVNKIKEHIVIYKEFNIKDIVNETLYKYNQLYKLNINSFIIKSDYLLFQLLIEQLIDNSFKFKEEQVTVISINTYKVKDKLYIDYKSNNKKIDKSFNIYLSKPFKKEDLNTEGVGLGLYIVSFIVEIIKGTISFINEKGEFSIQITL